MERWEVAADIADRLEELREVLGITQAALGQRGGVWPAQANKASLVLRDLPDLRGLLGQLGLPAR